MKSSIAAVALLISAPAAADPLIFDNGRLFIQSQLNGVATEALLDSGAEASLVDDDFARLVELPEGQAVTIRGSGGEEQAEIVGGATIAALGLSLQPEAVVVLDLGELSQRLIRRPTQLVVGRELFDSARLRIDIGGRTIDRVDSASEPEGRRLELVPHAGIESFAVTLNGQAAHAEFDLGNGSGVTVSRALADRLGLRLTGRRAGGGIGGQVERDMSVLDQIDVAGVAFRNVEVAIDDQPNANDLNIGTSILQHFLITTDFREKSLWLKPVGEAN